ncbi:HPOmp29 protein [Helicobacter pylori Hp H-41]|nr:HPOmp29 protein [Helicobacter pylori Hp H-41]
MKKIFLGMALAFSVSMAEKSGAFLGGGFQYSNLENQNTTRTSGANNNTPINTSMFGNNQAAPAQEAPSVINTNNYGQMYGVDAMAGYKWFFGKTKRFGFRSYGYYSYNHANLSFVGS